METEPFPPSRGDLSSEPFGERFVIEQLVATGGMGAVYRGIDRETGLPVAIKVLATGSNHAPRLSREATILAELSHPAIVRHIAHGVTSRDEPYLIMEWLEGEDLAARLKRAPLSVEQSILAVRRACEGLMSVHARGVVHRDIKPSNLFLVNGDPGLLKLLDFGIARLADGAPTMTRSGAVLGTVGYMSPEQATSSRDVDPRTDVFALGCVLYECVTGRPAFSGPNHVAVLAKILSEEPYRMAELRPGLEPALDALVARMLSKRAEGRPENAASVLRVLNTLGSAAGDAVVPRASPRGLTATEQRIVSVILGTVRCDAATLETLETGDAELAGIRSLTERIGAEPIALRSGGVLVLVTGRGAAHDQARQAATCALALARARPGARWTVATGKAETEGRLPVGAAIDRAAKLLDMQHSDPGEVPLDELTADLLPARFQLRRADGRCWLLDERADGEGRRLLLGKSRPFVGRDKELALLELTLRECLEESVVRAVIIEGPPGQGKSRLREEFVERLSERMQLRVWIARGDPVGAGSSFGSLRQISRQALNLREGTPMGEQRTALVRRVSALCAPASAVRVADFLGELIGLSTSDEVCPELRAARHDPSIMSTWLSRSFHDWFNAECAREPTLIVLEDLHWGDLPSVTYLGEAMRRPRDRPLMVLALARPELRKVFPNLWAGVEKVELQLGRLTNGVAKRLVQEAIGNELSPDVVQRLIERADGNPFYLEELIRHIANGRDELPETVLALVQSRLEQLPSDERWVVRAASVFGEVFWRGGLAALLGPCADRHELDRWLEALTSREVIAVVEEARFAGEREYAFRHGLFRDAAYSMLTDDDRARGHALAGEWLVYAGEKDALRLAEHFELGRQPKRAIPWILQAAFLTLDGGNLDATLRLAERAAACGADAHEQGLFAWMRAAVLAQFGDLAGAAAAGQQALLALSPGTSEWFQSAGNLFLVAAFLGEPGLVPLSLTTVLTTPPEQPFCGAYSWAICSVSSALVSTGELTLARSILERTEALTRPDQSDADPAFMVNLRVARGGLQLFTGELAQALQNLDEGCRLADRLELATQRATARYLLACALSQTGSVEHTDVVVRELEAFCDPRRMRFYSDRVKAIRASTLVESGRLDEAIALFLPLLESADRQLVNGVRTRLAGALFARGDLDDATVHARRALEQGSTFPSGRASALAILARCALARGRAAEALVIAEDGLSGRARGMWLRDRSTLQLVRAEALFALDRRGKACTAIREARDHILAVHSSLPDLPLRTSFVNSIEGNVRTLTLAAEWLADDAGDLDT